MLPFAFTALKFDSNNFVILLSKIVKPRDHNKIKPPIRKIFRKYKFQTLFFDIPKIILVLIYKQGL